MSTTTQILFNSPALHSLKREQLVKLCKIHGIKANGKNVDLIERLKQRAQDIPDAVDDATNVQNDSEDTDQDVGEGSSQTRPLTRPSEQWEMVMEDITEVEETGSMRTVSSMKSLQPQSSAGEFGTSNSKSSVSTSLKALANSLGLKRALSKSSSNSKMFPNSLASDLDKHAIPYSSLPPASSLPLTVNFPLSAQDVDMAVDDLSMSIPGGPAQPGRPAPANARLSTGEGVTTTIRLITGTSRDSHTSPPKLMPFKTSFDLIMSPGPNNSGRGISVWPPASPATQGRLYPSMHEIIATNHGASTSNVAPSLASARPAAKEASQTISIDQPEDIFSPQKKLAAVPRSVARASIARSEPFLFGSPLPANRPRTSNADFEKAATSVLNEMNQRLAASGIQGIDANMISKKITADTDVFGGTLNSVRRRTDNTTNRFAKAHEDAFSKMDSIATHYAARRGVQAAPGPNVSAQPTTKKRKSDALGLGPAPGPSKRKSSAVNSRVISNGTRKKMIHGGFGDDDDEEEPEQAVEDAGDRRSSKRIRVEENKDVHKGRRVSLLASVTAMNGETDEDRAREERKREVMKKKLDEVRARRRSSRGRVSVSGKPVPVKPKASRFGFLSSAKSLVRNVWNMGASGNSAAKAPSNIPVPKANLPSKTNAASAQAAQPPAAKAVSKPPSLGLGKPSSSKNADRLSAARVPSTSASGKSSMLSPDTAGTRKASFSRARSPIPTFHTPDNELPVERPKTGSSTASRIPSRSTSTSQFSSMGTRISTTPGTGGVSSVGNRGGLAPSMAGSSSRHRTDGTDSTIPQVSKRLSSTLMAPTASSLAKRQGAIRQPPRSPSMLQQIASSPQSPRSSATPGKIFTTPLTGFGSPTSIPTPVQKPSFTAAGTALFGTAVATGTPSTLVGPIPPKPKILVGRKPRISRSRVIAKLGAQRAASAGTSTAGATPAETRTRSSMGAARRSLGGVKAVGTRNSAGGDMMMSAKKRVRQSEIAARRRSRMTQGTSGMDVRDD